MTTSKIAGRVPLAVCTLLVLFLPALIHAQPSSGTVTKFLSSETRAYLEVTVDGSLQKIYTESRGDYKALFVFGKGDNPELLEFSFIDSSKKIVTFVLELRAEKDQVPPGRKVADRGFIESLQSDAEGFAEWQRRFSSFPDEATVSAILVDPSFASPVGFDIVAGDQIVFKPTDWLCCLGRYANPCSFTDRHLACVIASLCTVWTCIEAGEWTPECHDALEEAKRCMNVLQQ